MMFTVMMMIFMGRTEMLMEKAAVVRISIVFILFILAVEGSDSCF